MSKKTDFEGWKSSKQLRPEVASKSLGNHADSATRQVQTADQSLISTGPEMICLPSEALDPVLSPDDGKPIVLLNLLGSKLDDGKECYLQYLGMAGPLAARYGAKIV